MKNGKFLFIQIEIQFFNTFKPIQFQTDEVFF